MTEHPRHPVRRHYVADETGLATEFVPPPQIAPDPGCGVVWAAEQHDRPPG